MLDWQLANRMSEKYIINAACQKFKMGKDEPGTINTSFQPTGKFEISPNSCQFSIVITKQESDKQTKVVFQWLLSNQKIMMLSNEILISLVSHFGCNIYQK